MDHAAHQPAVEGVAELELPLPAQGGQIALLHGIQWIERHQQVDQTPHQPEQQQGAAVAPGHGQRRLASQSRLQKVTGTEEKQRYGKAA